MDRDLKSAALVYVREIHSDRETSRQEILASCEVRLRVKQELAHDIICARKYQRREELSLILEARQYVKGRLPVHDRATAVAILLQRDAVRGEDKL
jgi:hypothetical protein